MSSDEESEARTHIAALMAKFPSVKAIEIFRLLIALNGSVHQVENILKGSGGATPWTTNEDKILLGDDEKSINLIITFRGYKAVPERLNFLLSGMADD